jgi:serine phosphatase RsbU (regulator of sigma subunit)
LIINKKIERKVTLFWLVCSFIAAHLCFLLFPNVFDTWQEQTIDRVLRFKSSSNSLRPAYDDTIVLIDINNTSLHSLDNFYLNRSHHARVIRNLSAMNVSAQMYDFIFGAPRDAAQDSQLIEATKASANAYFGMAFRLASSTDGTHSSANDTKTRDLLKKTSWKIENSRAAAKFYSGKNPLITFAALSDVARGIGYLSLKPDPDGVFRRLPLLVRYDDAYYPSFALRTACDYLNVPAARIIIEPGKVILKDAEKTGASAKRDIVIPVDKFGNMRVNFVGAWGRMQHYNFSDVYFASEDPDEMELWQEELTGKIVLISDVSTGSTDVGPVPTDADYPLSGIHANSVHTILTGSFLKDLTAIETLILELILLFAVALLSFHRSAILFTLGTFAVAGGFICIAGLFVFYTNTLFPIVRPLLMVFFTLITLHIVSAVENARTHAQTEKAREVAERDLEIGRQIQSGFFPGTLPSPSNWEIAAYFKPARQVAGDFYDVFELGKGEYIGIVIADVCDKGVGAALFMALIRSLIRAFATQNYGEKCNNHGSSQKCSDEFLLSTVQQTNNYIAITHSDANMFATLFLGILDPAGGNLKYVNCGHEPPVVVRQGTVKARLKPTGPAVGMMPDLDFHVAENQFDQGDMLFAFTDGLTDAENERGELFTRERLLDLLTVADESAAALTERVKQHLGNYIAGAAQFDDMTMVAVRRKND